MADPRKHYRMTISGEIAGEHPIVVDFFSPSEVTVHIGAQSATLPREDIAGYASNVAGLVKVLKARVTGVPPEEVEESDKDRADRLAAALNRIANESREHFATSIAMDALQGGDHRTE